MDEISSMFFNFLTSLDYTILSFFNLSNSHLLSIDDNFFRNFFITLGASFLGVLAIVFSLSLFAIQYASENNTPKIFERFREDKRNKLVYVSIGIMVIIFFIFSIFPISRIALSLELYFTFIFVIFLLWLLNYQYRSVTYSINPIDIINTLKKETLKKISSIEEGLNKNTKEILSKDKPDRSKNTDTIKASFFMNNNVSAEILSDIEEIFDLIIKNSKKSNYEVTWQGFLSLYEIIKRYLKLRSGTFVDLSVFNVLGADSSQDHILVQTYENLFSIQRIAIGNKDLKLSKQVLRILVLMTKESISLKYLNKSFGDNPIFNLSAGYSFQIAKEGISEGFYDLGIDISDYYSALSRDIISSGSGRNLITISRNLAEIANIGIVKKQFFLVDYPLGAISKFLQDLSLSEHYDRATFNLILGEAKKTTLNYIALNSNGSGLDSNLDVQSSLGRFIDLVKPQSIGSTISTLCQAIIEEKRNKQRRRLINNLLSINDELWKTFDYILQVSEKTNSFANYFIGSNISHICKNLIDLYKIGNLEDRDKKELLEDIRWYLSDFWRMLNYKEKDFENLNLFDIEDDLLFMGYKFLNMGLVDEAKNINDIIFSMGKIVLEKGGDRYGFTAPRIIMTACKLAIYSKSCSKCEDISDNLIKKIASIFYPAYTSKYDWQKDIFSKELSSLDPLDKKHNGLHVMFEDRLISEMTEKGIKSFLEDLEKTISGNEEKAKKD